MIDPQMLLPMIGGEQGLKNLVSKYEPDLAQKLAEKQSTSCAPGYSNLTYQVQVVQLKDQPPRIVVSEHSTRFNKETQQIEVSMPQSKYTLADLITALFTANKPA